MSVNISGNQLIVETKNLSKNFGKVKALTDLNLQIEQNSIYGLLGCNGAGKTTTFSILAGLVKKTSGTVIVDGIDMDKFPEEIKNKIGIMPQKMQPYANKTAYESMLFYAMLKGMKRTAAMSEIDKLFKELEVEEIKKIKAKNLSHGQSNSILVMQAFLNSPKVVILDEPFNGLDIKRVILLRDFIKKKRKDTTIILSSHNIDEIDRIATHVGILNEGKLVLQGKKDKVKKGKSLEKVLLENM